MARQSLQPRVDDFLSAIGLLIRRVRGEASHQGLSLTESAVLGRLMRQGPSTAADLARAESVKPQSMAAIIAGLEESGLVNRERHPTDRRQFHVALTPKGAALRKSVRDAKLAWLLKAISQLDDGDRETLLRAGEIVKRIAEGE